MICLVDYGVGNLGSAANMFRKAGVDVHVTSDPEVLVNSATKLVLPGVGSFDAGMAALRTRGLVPALNHCVLQAGIPTLGFCLGMHLMTRCSEEGNEEGLGWLDARTVRFDLSALPERRLKIPNIGWKQLRPVGTSPLLERIDPGESRFYFAHSYHLVANDPLVVAVAKHGYEFPAVIHHDNIYATQFHPEKSLRHGLALITNFVRL
jgi:glutamine amidotransferase